MFLLCFSSTLVAKLLRSRALLEHGLAGLAIFDVSTKHDILERLKSDFPEASIVAYDVDITSSPAVEKAVSAAATALGPISHLLCFAGIVDCAHAVDTSPLTFRRVIDVNTTGSFIVAQTVARQMMTAGIRGSIMFTASISGHRVNYPQPQVAYNVSKAAVAAMVKSLAAEWAHAGIRVNSISPGYMVSAICSWRSMHVHAGAMYYVYARIGGISWQSRCRRCY